jgi:hypothetical protein
MYVQLLQEAMETRQSDSDVPTRALVTELDRCRRFLPTLHRNRATSEARGADAPDSINAQIAYDLALLDLCDRVGVGHDLSLFGYPGKERTRLESILIERGIMAGGDTQAGEPSPARRR